jgi:hypothetical protein
VEKLDESLHGSFDEKVSKKETKRLANNEIGKPYLMTKQAKRHGFGYFNQSQSNDALQNS